MSTTTTTESIPAQETERPFPHKFNSGDILYADDLNTMTSAIVSALNVTTTIGTAFSYKGSVSTEAKLPKTAANGDVYNVEDTGMNYVYTGTEWDPLGASLENYATKTDISNINTNITTLTNTVNLKASQTDLTTVSTKVDTNITNITNLSNTVNEHTNSIISLTANVDKKANQTDLNAVSTKTDTNVANIASLTTSVNEHTNSITTLTNTVNEKANQTDLDELSDTVEKMITFVKWTE